MVTPALYCPYVTSQHTDYLAVDIVAMMLVFASVSLK
jgi:hypothetical protein